MVIAIVPPSVPTPRRAFSPTVRCTPSLGSCTAAKATIVAMTTALLQIGASAAAVKRRAAWSRAVVTAPTA